MQAGDLDSALRDLEESRVENERKDVELDQTLQDRESSMSSLDVRVNALREELLRVKQERDTLGESKATLLNGRLFIPSLLICFCFLNRHQKAIWSPKYPP
jgi:chromosome segregation ATPase